MVTAGGGGDVTFGPQPVPTKNATVRHTALMACCARLVSRALLEGHVDGTRLGRQFRLRMLRHSLSIVSERLHASGVNVADLTFLVNRLLLSRARITLPVAEPVKAISLLSLLDLTGLDTALVERGRR